jgi:decaprenylphospho-beta-D-ribofuranose 2-oxidase
VSVQLISFDGTERCRAALVAPDRYRDLRAALRCPGPLAVRGAGLSYCQASAGDGTTTVSTASFNRILAFDPVRRHLTVEPGVSVGELVRFAISRDSWFPVLPGHPAITVGGCVAFNVHGKSQHDVGCFSDHVVALTLTHPDHGEQACTPDNNADILELTLGGMGLTGYISSVTLRLQRLPGRAIRRTAHRVSHLNEAVELMQSLAREPGSRTLYSWNDLNHRGPRFGHGFVYAESFEAEVRPSRVSYRSLTPGPRRGPSMARSRAVTRLVNAAYAAGEHIRPVSLRSLEDAAFPINGREAYYRLFGRRGFREYQVLIPSEAWPSAAHEIERTIAAAGVGVTLGSLKLFRGDRRLMWFCGEGVCLAIDVAADERAHWLLSQLDAVAREHDALVNLSKDSRLDAATVQALYAGGYDDFRRRLADHDIEGRFDSMLRRRIGI